MAQNSPNPRSSKIREFLRIYFLESPLLETKAAKEKALYLGCGWGFYFKINPLAYGIDIDKNCIEYLKRKGLKAIQGDITQRLPFQNNSFEWIVCHDVLEHFELAEAKKIFKETHRILLPKGRFLIVVPNKKGYNSGIKRNVGHKHFITPKEIFLLVKNKFTREKNFSHPLPRFIGDYFTHNKEIIVLRKK